MENVLLIPHFDAATTFAGTMGLFALGMWCVIGIVELCHAQRILKIADAVSVPQNTRSFP